MSTAHPDRAHHDWVIERIAQRTATYPLPRAPATFDILTLVFETDPIVLRETATSVLAQQVPRWRWVIFDNGSTRPDTRAVLAELSQRPNIVVQSARANVGIVEGHFLGLELCTSEYVALLDHDDLLPHDALRIAAWHIDQFDRPDFLYSDEDKCDIEGRRFSPFFKPDYSPALLNDFAYTCHLSVVKRARLSECGAFSDASVEGTQDWDMALRLTDYGCSVVHIPEILYSWRTLPSSTSLTLSSKPYVLDAQQNCLRQHLRRRALDDRFDIISNPLFPSPDGHWWIRRRPGPPHLAVLPSGEMSTPAWLLEAVGLFELIPDLGLVCGRASTPAGHFHLNWCRRDVSDALELPWVARASAAEAVGGLGGHGDFGERMRRGGWRTVATPFIGLQTC